MTTLWHIRDVRLVDPSRGRDSTGDLFIQNGRFVEPPAAPASGVKEIDGRNLTALPGLVDIHVHLREPGNEAAETVETGCRAAARGGFTSIVAMPNTTPAMDSPEQVQALRERSTACGLVRVWPAPCITRGRTGAQLTDFDGLVQSGAVAFTDDGSTVSSDAVMGEAMKRARALDRPILDHALDPRLAGHGAMHAGARSESLGLPGIPSEAEVRIVERDLRLASETGCAVHIQHLSAAGSVALLRRARRNGIRASGELTPHHLALIDADVTAEHADRFKMNPPVREAADRAALIEALLDGTIECFATDHAPHTAAAKAKGFTAAPFGVVGLETAVGVTYSLLVKRGLMSVLDWAQRWTAGPARIVGLPTPTLEVGAPADVVLLDLTREWVVDPGNFLSKSRNTPFDNWTLTGQAVWTFHDGQPAWHPDLASTISH